MRGAIRLQVGAAPSAQQLEKARAFERSHRPESARLVSADWLHACAAQRRLVPPEDYPFTGVAVVTIPKSDNLQCQTPYHEIQQNCLVTVWCMGYVVVLTGC